MIGINITDDGQNASIEVTISFERSPNGLREAARLILSTAATAIGAELQAEVEAHVAYFETFATQWESRISMPSPSDAEKTK